MNTKFMYKWEPLFDYFHLRTVQARQEDMHEAPPNMNKSWLQLMTTKYIMNNGYMGGLSSSWFFLPWNTLCPTLNGPTIHFNLPGRIVARGLLTHNFLHITVFTWHFGHHISWLDYGLWSVMPWITSPGPVLIQSQYNTALGPRCGFILADQW